MCHPISASYNWLTQAFLRFVFPNQLETMSDYLEEPIVANDDSALAVLLFDLACSSIIAALAVAGYSPRPEQFATNSWWSSRPSS